MIFNYSSTFHGLVSLMLVRLIHVVLCNLDYSLLLVYSILMFEIKQYVSAKYTYSTEWSFSVTGYGYIHLQETMSVFQNGYTKYIIYY